MSAHEWELKGGATAHGNRDLSTTGVVLWQCTECGIAASRHLTYKHTSSRDVVLDTPEVDEECGSSGPVVRSVSGP